MNDLYPAFALIGIYSKEILMNVCKVGLDQRRRTTMSDIEGVV